MNKQGIETIEDLGKKLELQSHIVEVAKGLYDISLQGKSIHQIGHGKKYRMIACLLIEAKRSPSCPMVSIKEWIRKLEPKLGFLESNEKLESNKKSGELSFDFTHDKRIFINIYNDICKNFVHEPPKQCSYNPEPFIDKIVNSFEYYNIVENRPADKKYILDKVKLKTKALELLELVKINNLKAGHNPSIIAAVCVYGASILTKQQLSISSVSNANFCSSAAIGNLFYKIKDIWGLIGIKRKEYHAVLNEIEIKKYRESKEKWRL